MEREAGSGTRQDPSPGGREQRLAALRTEVSALGVQVRLNANRRVLISLRQRPARDAVLSLHADLLDHPQALAVLPRWIRARGRGTDAALREALSQVWHQLNLRSAPAPCPDLEPVGGGVDAAAILARVHGIWFSHLPSPLIRWSRASPRRRLRHIRFGCYRKGPPPEILVNPRLREPWIARVFLEHVVYHELCHHLQACQPVRGEKAHSRRFRLLERGYPHHDQALAWERTHLGRLLADDADPGPWACRPGDGG